MIFMAVATRNEEHKKRPEKAYFTAILIIKIITTATLWFDRAHTCEKGRTSCNTMSRTVSVILYPSIKLLSNYYKSKPDIVIRRFDRHVVHMPDSKLIYVFRLERYLPRRKISDIRAVPWGVILRAGRRRGRHTNRLGRITSSLVWGNNSWQNH